MTLNKTRAARNFSAYSATLTQRALFAVTLVAASVGPASAAQLVAGSPPSSAPTTYLDTKTGKIAGYMPEIAAEIAKREGLPLDFQAVPFPALIQSVISGKIDMIVAGMTPTPKRAEVIDFSQVVTAFGEGIVVSDDNKKEYKSAKDFSDDVVGIMAGTDYSETVIKNHYAKDVKIYDSPADMARDVSLHRIALGMTDYPILKAQEAAGALKGMHVVESYTPMKAFGVAFGVKKGNTELLNKINAALDSMRADGTLDAILVRYGMTKK
ncbi:transporter substrate-binding domain-containing protein [Caballeronia sp. AZ7_KS35]|uniref:ABC transporter substrate-binding protein n=1 Tax=Caballeronia sp. AZ7_KS35 TaxID=2921762 RepID=UPI0020289C3A|nr:transporter substrate-binding domain-containing protein [Caballeronia sp. AZ7_KS35]